MMKQLLTALIILLLYVIVGISAEPVNVDPPIMSSNKLDAWKSTPMVYTAHDTVYGTASDYVTWWCQMGVITNDSEDDDLEDDNVDIGKWDPGYFTLSVLIDTVSGDTLTLTDAYFEQAYDTSGTIVETITDASTTAEARTLTKAGENFNVTCTVGDYVVVNGGTTVADYGTYLIEGITSATELIVDRAFSTSNTDVDFTVSTPTHLIENADSSNVFIDSGYYTHTQYGTWRYLPIVSQKKYRSMCLRLFIGAYTRMIFSATVDDTFSIDLYLTGKN